MKWILGFVLAATLHDPLGPRTRLKTSSQASQWGQWPRPGDVASISLLDDGRQAMRTQTRRAPLGLSSSLFRAVPSGVDVMKDVTRFTTGSQYVRRSPMMWTRLPPDLLGRRDVSTFSRW
jgi:hypothetical protein